MRETTFVDAKEMDIGTRKVILIYVPVPQLKLYRQVQVYILPSFCRVVVFI